MVVGNSDVAKADPDWVGFLDPENGVSIARTVRESADDLVEGDGGVHGSFWHGRATIALQGVLWPDAADIGTVTERESKLRRATRALRGDSVLRFAPTGFGERAFWVRRQQDPAITGRRPKSFQVQLVSAKPYGLSPTESQAIITPGAASGELGISSPISSPLSSPVGVSGQQTVVNAGDVETWPRFQILGPISNPRIVNNSTGQEIRFTYTLGAGEFLDVYPEVGAVLLAGNTNRYSAYDRANSKWWQLMPGTNDIRLLSSSFSTGAQLTVWWRSAWE